MNGTMIKRGGKWSVILDVGYEPSGKRMRRWHSGFRSKKEAEKARITLLHDLETGTYVEPSKTPTGDFLLRWLDSYAKANVAQLTFIRYSQIVKGRVMRDLGGIPLRKLRPDDILAARAKWGRREDAPRQGAQRPLHAAPPSRPARSPTARRQVALAGRESRRSRRRAEGEQARHGHAHRRAGAGVVGGLPGRRVWATDSIRAADGPAPGRSPGLALVGRGP